jgi:D-alanyl-D-alanine carboxypeptidase
MPSLMPGRGSAVLLSLVLVMGSVATAAGQEPNEVEPAGPPIPPPTLGAALSVLYLPSGLLAGSDGLEPAKVKLPACRIQDIPTRYTRIKDWQKTLLDTNLKLPRSYKPWDLVSVRQANIAGSGKVRKIMIKDLKALARAARKAGKPLAVRSAYRSYDYQRALFDSYVRNYGYDQAIKFSARPGHSEHQLGTTVDFSTGPGVPLSTRFGDSPAGKWIARNGWKYGFIMMYPKGKRKASCYGYEPWHWRYFGRALARKIQQSGQVPRRYLYRNFELAP